MAEFKLLINVLSGSTCAREVRDPAITDPRRAASMTDTAPPAGALEEKTTRQESREA